MKKFFSHKKAIILIITAAASAFLIFFNRANDAYWSGPRLTEITPALLSFQNKIEQEGDKTDSLNEAVSEANKNAAPVRTETEEFFNACNALIISYFKDNYNIDVSERLSELVIMESDYPNNVSEQVGGAYNKDNPDKLFINKAVIDSFTAQSANGGAPDPAGREFETKMLRTVYIHEVMHYLGFNTDLGFDYFMESAAEALNKEITEYNNIPYESITGYSDIQDYAELILKCDPEFIKTVLSNDRLDVADYFNSHFNGVPDTDYAGMLDTFIGTIRTGEDGILDKTKYYAQYLTAEYCKNTNKDARSIFEKTQNAETALFNIKRNLGFYNGII